MSTGAQETSGPNLAASLKSLQFLAQEVENNIRQVRTALFGCETVAVGPESKDANKGPNLGLVGNSLGAAAGICRTLERCNSDLSTILQRVDTT